jgi:hypothetical protein
VALYASIDQSKLTGAPGELADIEITELTTWPRVPLPDEHLAWRRELEENGRAMERQETAARLYAAFWIVSLILWTSYVLLAWSTGIFSISAEPWRVAASAAAIVTALLGLCASHLLFRHLDAWRAVHEKAVRSLDEADRHIEDWFFAKFRGATYRHIGGSRLPGS